MNLIFTHKQKLLKWLTGIVASFLISLNSIAQTPPDLIFDPVITGLSSMVDVVNANDGTNRLFIVRQSGTVRIVSGGVLLPGIFLDIPDSISTGGERGLLSIAFHPNFKINRYFFIYYTNTAGNIRISRFQTQVANPNAADESTGVVLLTIPHPTYANHNGGKLNFGPDGNLYFGTGDGGSGGDPNGNAQNGNSLLGKMIRINVDDFLTPPYYSIPADNPYISDPAVRDEIFTLGLRNPWRWSFDRLNNDVWIADVGQNAWEEINNRPYAASGGINYGWRCYEGNAAYNTAGCLPPANYISPIYNYSHNNATGGYSVTGGYVYRAAQFPAMYGYYICADYVSGNTWLIKSNGVGGWNVWLRSGLATSITGFGEAENGDLYAVSLNGTFYKVITSSVTPVTLLQFTAKAFTAYNELRWKTINEQNIAYYEIEYSADGVNYTSAGKINAVNLPTEYNYSFQHPITLLTKIFYRLKIKDTDGKTNFSNVVKLDKKEWGNFKIYPTLVTGNEFNIVSGKAVEQVIIFSADGKKVLQKRLNNLSGTIPVLLPDLQNGFYFVQIKLENEFLKEKILVHRK